MSSPQSRFKRGTEQLFLGRMHEAAEELQLAFQDNPDDFATVFNLIIALCSNGCRKLALKLCPRMIDTAPWNARVYLLYANVLAINEKYQESKSSLDIAALLAPSDPLVLACVGRMQILDGDPRGIAVLRATMVSQCLPEILKSSLVGEVRELASSPEFAKLPMRSLCAEPFVLACQGVRREATRSVSVRESKPACTEIAIDAAAELVSRAKSIVAITGAGLSAPSGLRTRKDLWSEFSRDEAVSVWRARESPEVLWDVIRQFLGAQTHAPNSAHHALSRLPRLSGIITQNIDRLHHRVDGCAVDGLSASSHIVELHGSFDSTSCWECGKKSDSCFEWVRKLKVGSPKCDACHGVLRPDVVLFGESVLHENLAKAKDLVRGCDLVLVIGCAMDVMPASELPCIANANGASVIEFKRNPSRLAKRMTTQLVRGCVSETLPALIDKLFPE